MAEELPLALRWLWSGEGKPSCNREERFIEMYAALGDGEAQQQIRAQYAGESHCKLLLKNARACAGCPNNPYEKPDTARKIKHVEEYWGLLQDAMELHSAARLGLLGGKELTMTQTAAVLAIDAEIEMQKARMQGEIVAAAVAKMMVQAFGAK